MNDEQLIWEAYETNRKPSTLPTEDEVRDAADTQRGLPEHQMLECQRALPHGIIATFIEHIGDLAHRAQNQNALLNVDEKLKMIEQTEGTYRLSIEDEIEENNTENAKNYVRNKYPELKSIWDRIMNFQKLGLTMDQKREDIMKINELLDTKYKPQVVERIDYIKKLVKKELAKYTKAHEQYNNPITTLGKMGKAAAIALGNQNFDLLRQIVKNMRQWLNEYHSLKTEKQKLEKFLS